MRIRYPLFAALALTIAVLACNAPVPESMQAATATYTPTLTPPAPSATTPPTLTPTATPPPTATVIPQSAVDEANAALLNGDYVRAVRGYRSVLDQPMMSVNPALRAAASFSAGVAALREGLFKDAVTGLSAFLSDYPDDPRAAQAHFLRADAYLGTAEWQAAIDDLTLYLKLRPGLLDSYAWERIGDAQLALQQPEQALTAYANASKGSPRSLSPLVQLREKLAAAYLNAGNLKAAIAQYDEILKVAKNESYRADIALTAAQTLAASGDSVQATARYQAIIKDYPTQLPAYRALVALTRGGTPVDDYTRGTVAFAAQDYGTTILAFNNYTSYTALDAVDPNIFLKLGVSYRESGNPAAALTSFQTLIEKYPKASGFGQAWLEQGRTLFLSGSIADSIAKYKELAVKFPAVLEGAEALSRAAYLQAQQGDRDGALATYDQLGKQYPGSEQGMDAIFKAGMLAFTQGARDRASQMFALLATTGKGPLKAAGAFWLGRIYQLDNDPSQARIAYQQAAKADPYGYYSARANDILNGHGPLLPPARYDWAFNDPAHIAEADAWMRSTFKVTAVGDLWRLAPELVSDARKLRGDELWTVAAYEQARAEYAGLRDEYAANPLVLYQLATYFYQIGLYREAISTAELLIASAKIGPAQAPRAIAALAYPIAYYDLVLPAAQKYKLDPLLVFALMRQESLYESFAKSYAAAQGLMQIIPDTGAYIAQKLSWPDYQNSDLFRPFVNVEFGIYYLSEQLTTFNGNSYAALAAYNGGPGSSAEWLRISGGDPDFFLQAIEYDETQTYVRRIYEQYQVYAAIYGAK